MGKSFQEMDRAIDLCSNDKPSFLASIHHLPTNTTRLRLALICCGGWRYHTVPRFIKVRLIFCLPFFYRNSASSLYVIHRSRRDMHDSKSPSGGPTTRKTELFLYLDLSNCLEQPPVCTTTVPGKNYMAKGCQGTLAFELNRLNTALTKGLVKSLLCSSPLCYQCALEANNYKPIQRLS